MSSIIRRANNYNPYFLQKSLHSLRPLNRPLSTGSSSIQKMDKLKSKITTQYQPFRAFLQSIKQAPRFENNGQTAGKMPFDRYFAFGIAGCAAASLFWYKKDTFAAEETIKPKPWHQIVRDAIMEQISYYYSPQRSKERPIRSEVEQKIVADCQKLSEKHPKTFIDQIFDYDELNMAGVAIIASYLRQKKGLNNLFVCKSQEAFQKKLDEISRLKGDTRVALVMSDWPEVDEDDDKKDGEYGAVTVHKIAICIEKTGPQIKIAILDPMADKEYVISPFQVLAPPKDLKYIILDGIGYPLWYIFHSSLNMKNTSIYYSPIKRQRTFNGCETFALTDGVAFLRDPQFFEKVQTKTVLIQEKGLQLKLHRIESLPPAFMAGTQSLKLLDDYYEKNLKSQDPKEMEELKRKVKKNLVEVNGKLQNHYNDKKSIKYHLITIAALEAISTNELQQSVRETLLTIPRLPSSKGQPPLTLSDLHYYNPIVITEQD
jgi:hypothetical protein